MDAAVPDPAAAAGTGWPPPGAVAAVRSGRWTVLSFSLATLAGTWLLGALGLPFGLLRWIGIVAIGVLGVGLLVPAVGDLLERPLPGSPPGARCARPEDWCSA